MHASQRVTVHEESQIGEARRAVAEVCRRWGDETFCGRGAILVTELTRNLVKHAGGGELVFRELSDPQHPGVEFLALDRGPGMKNVADCLRDGYSTSGTAGTGLGAVRRMADCFELHSAPGHGTAVWCRLCPPEPRSLPAAGALEIGAVNLALAGEEVCGDAWTVLERPGFVRVLVADGLGHGVLAADAAREAVAVFREHPDRPIAFVLDRMHEALRKTRGAAASIAEINLEAGRLTMGGVGNVVVRVLDHDGGSQQLVSVNGTLGSSLRAVQEFTRPWSITDTLVLHSDGLSAQWNLTGYAGLVGRHPGLLAGVLYRDFARLRDDATVVALRISS